MYYANTDVSGAVTSTSTTTSTSTSISNIALQGKDIGAVCNTAQEFVYARARVLARCHIYPL